MANARRPVSLLQAALGLTLFATIALPVSPGGRSLLELLLEVAANNPLGAVMLLATFGCPQLFGLAVAFAWLSPDAPGVRVAVTWSVALMQAMLVMIGVNMLGTSSEAVLALLGFALTTGIYLPDAAGEAAASTREQLSLRWYVRWGALLIAGFGLWLRLQSLAGLRIGPAIDVALVAAALLLVSLAPREPVTAPADADADV
jgi:hypothetical protein